MRLWHSSTELVLFCALMLIVAANFSVEASIAGPEIKKAITSAKDSTHLEESMPSCLKKLMKAESFSDDVRGESPGLRPEYLAYKEAAGMIRNLSVSQLESVITHGTPAGRLYACVLLSHKMIESDKQCYDRLLADKANVDYFSGCRGTTNTVGQIAHSLLETGKYLNFKPAAADLVRVGMTRAEVEKDLHVDGGLSTAFKSERYVVNASGTARGGKVAKVDISFKPAGMSDEVYYLGKWVASKQSPGDVVMKVSRPYVEPPYFD